MILRVFIALLLCALLIFGVIWIMSGGLTRAIHYASTISNPLELFAGSASGTPFRLPGQPDLDTLGAGTGLEAGSKLENAIYETDLGGAADGTQVDPQTYGNPSKSAGAVTLAYGNAGSGSTADEYIVISAATSNTAPVSLGGWSLQSAYTGVRHTLPQAAPNFIQGAVNPVQPVSLAPGSSAVVSSGISPVGVSFRENACAGYLAQFQEFSPPLQARCVSASATIPDTAETRASLGDTCFDFLATVPSCTFPRSFPADISPACASTLTQALSYNSCVRVHRGDTTFTGSTWRLYLAASHPLWRDHDVVRLLDPAGRIVDVLSY
jgi:hypothetical protein